MNTDTFTSMSEKPPQKKREKKRAFQNVGVSITFFFFLGLLGFCAIVGVVETQLVISGCERVRSEDGRKLTWQPGWNRIVGLVIPLTESVPRSHVRKSSAASFTHGEDDAHANTHTGNRQQEKLPSAMTRCFFFVFFSSLTTVKIKNS